MPDGAGVQRPAITIITHRGLPNGGPDDIILARALTAAGATVRFAFWDDPAVHWSETQVGIVRSTWDYHRSPRRWLDWIKDTSASTMLINSAPILRWNTDKRYLRELAANGIACIPTAFVEPGDRLTLRSVMRKQGWSDVVVKPAIGASATGARRFTEGAAAEAGEKHLAELATSGVVLVQPYLAQVEIERERSLVFIDGVFAHAFTKPPFNTDASGGTAILTHAPSDAELALATAALAASPGPPAYARVDLIAVEDGPMLMELELIEPDLGLRLDQAAADRLARVCISYAEDAVSADSRHSV